RQQAEEEEEIATVKTNKLKRIIRPVYVYAFIILFISSFGLMAFESLFSLYVDHKFGFSPKDIAIIITGAALVGAITQVLLFDKLTKRFGEVRLVRYCLWFSGTFVFLMTTAHSYAYILFVTIFIFTGFDLLRPA